MPEDTPLYVVCAADEIEPGGAKGFRLSRIAKNGEARPFAIVIVRKTASEYFAYENACPHLGVWLNIGDGAFLDESGTYLRCGRHGALFEIESGFCMEGPCMAKSLERIAVSLVDGEVCISGVELVEDDGHPDLFDDVDETMEIMIHPD